MIERKTPGHGQQCKLCLNSGDGQGNNIEIENEAMSSSKYRVICDQNRCRIWTVQMQIY